MTKLKTRKGKLGRINYCTNSSNSSLTSTAMHCKSLSPSHFYVPIVLQYHSYRIVAQLKKGRHAESCALDGLQKLLRNDHIGVHVLNVQFCRDSL